MPPQHPGLRWPQGLAGRCPGPPLGPCTWASPRRPRLHPSQQARESASETEAWPGGTSSQPRPLCTAHGENQATGCAPAEGAGPWPSCPRRGHARAERTSTSAARGACRWVAGPSAKERRPLCGLRWRGAEVLGAGTGTRAKGSSGVGTGGPVLWALLAYVVLSSGARGWGVPSSGLLGPALGSLGTGS